MKIHKLPVFSPITITLETQEEASTLVRVFQNSRNWLQSRDLDCIPSIPKREREMYELLLNECNKTF